LRLLFAQLAPRYGRPAERHPAARALRERRSLRFAVDDDALDEIAQSAEHRRLIAQIPVKHGVSIPMVGRARLIGVLSFFRFTDQPFADSEVAFAEELARRAALSVDNAILHEHTRRAVQAREDLLAVVSHDLRSPLTSIRMAAELLQRDGSRDEAKRRDLATRVGRAANGMMHLIEDLLDASKMESGTFSIEARAEPLAPLLADALDFYRDAALSKSIALVSEKIGSDVPEVICDRDRMLQVFSNLIGNALKFTPAEGTVTVSVALIAGEVGFSVCDNGPGIPEDAREHVFDRYWQAKQTRRGGAGLGLFIVRGIVEAHGGRVWARSADTGGACLCFTLPARASTSRERAPSPDPPDPPEAPAMR
jgi:signal transduction histidine kinase